MNICGSFLDPTLRHPCNFTKVHITLKSNSSIPAPTEIKGMKSRALTELGVGSAAVETLGFHFC